MMKGTNIFVTAHSNGTNAGGCTRDPSRPAVASLNQERFKLGSHVVCARDALALPIVADGEAVSVCYEQRGGCLSTV